MKRSGLLSFMTAFFVTLIFLSLIALLFVADNNTRAIGGNPRDEALLAFSPVGPAQLEITVMGERYLLSLDFPPLRNAAGAVERFYRSVAPTPLRDTTATLAHALPALWEGYCSAARWLASHFFSPS